MAMDSINGKARLAFAREAHWRERVRRQSRSGLSQAAFCRRHNLVPGTFAWWTRELRRRDQKRHTPSPPRPTFLPVHVLPAPRPVVDGALRVQLANGRRVQVGPGFDPDTLRELLQILEEPR